MKHVLQQDKKLHRLLDLLLNRQNNIPHNLSLNLLLLLDLDLYLHLDIYGTRRRDATGYRNGRYAAENGFGTRSTYASAGGSVTGSTISETGYAMGYASALSAASSTDTSETAPR